MSSPSMSSGCAGSPALRRTKPARARSAWARTTGLRSVGITWTTSTAASKWRPRAAAKRSASSACGPPRTGARIRRTVFTPRCLTTQMSHGPSRTTSSMVGERRLPSSAGHRRAAPAEDDQVGFFLGRDLDDALRGAAADAHDRAQVHARWRELEDSLQPAAAPASLRVAPSDSGMPSGTRRCQRRQRAARSHQPGADAHQIGGCARVGQRQQGCAPARLSAKPLPSPPRRRSIAASVGRGRAWPPRMRAWRSTRLPPLVGGHAFGLRHQAGDAAE